MEKIHDQLKTHIFNTVFHFILFCSIKDMPIVTEQIDSITHNNGLQLAEW